MPWSAPPARRWCTGGSRHDAPRARRRPACRRSTPSPAPTSCATPAPAATSTRSTGPSASPPTSGCPGVIAHGMYTMALAARAVATWTDDATVLELGCKFTQPVVVPDDDTGRGRGRGRHRQERRGRSGHPRPRGPLRASRRCWACPAPWSSSMGEPGRPRLAERTTLRLGGPPSRWVRAATETELVETVAAADAGRRAGAAAGRRQQPRRRRRGLRRHGRRGRHPGRRPRRRAPGPTTTPPAAGSSSRSPRGRTGTPSSPPPSSAAGSGVEALSGIPGCVGATPVQNVGAYGQEVAQTIASVRTWDRRDRRVRTLANADCDFAYRHSRFKAEPGRHVVLSVTFQLAIGTLGAPVRYGELARALGVEAGGRAPLGEVRDAVLGAARRQGHGPRRRRPRHLERRVVLHQPRPRRRTCCPRARRPGSSPTAGSRPAPRGSSSTPASPAATAPTSAPVEPGSRPSTPWR